MSSLLVVLIGSIAFTLALPLIDFQFPHSRLLCFKKRTKILLDYRNFYLKFLSDLSLVVSFMIVPSFGPYTRVGLETLFSCPYHVILLMNKLKRLHSKSEILNSYLACGDFKIVET